MRVPLKLNLGAPALLPHSRPWTPQVSALVPQHFLNLTTPKQRTQLEPLPRVRVLLKPSMSTQEAFLARHASARPQYSGRQDLATLHIPRAQEKALVILVWDIPKARSPRHLCDPDSVYPGRVNSEVGLLFAPSDLSFPCHSEVRRCGLR